MDETYILTQLRLGKATPEMQKWAADKIEQLAATKSKTQKDVWERPFASGHGYNEQQ